MPYAPSLSQSHSSLSAVWSKPRAPLCRARKGKKSYLPFIVSCDLPKQETVGTADMLVVRTSTLGVYTGNHSCPCPSKALGNLAIQDVDSSSKWQLAGAVSSLPVGLGDDMVPLHLQRGLTTQSRAALGHQDCFKSCLLALVLVRTEGGLCRVPILLHGGYLGTGHSGKHLIATLRRGDVRNKGNCVGSRSFLFLATVAAKPSPEKRPPPLLPS